MDVDSHSQEQQMTAPLIVAIVHTADKLSDQSLHEYEETRLSKPGYIWREKAEGLLNNPSLAH